MRELRRSEKRIIIAASVACAVMGCVPHRSASAETDGLAMAPPGNGDTRDVIVPYIPAAFSYHCGRWFARPADGTVLADLRLSRAPGAADEDAVRRAGGIVLYRFHVPALRAAISVSAVERLVDGEVFTEAVGVRDPRRFDAVVAVRLSRRMTAGDSAALARIGARLSADGARVTLPDSAVDELRKMPVMAEIAPVLPMCPGE
ncbi:MAG TPA: hypothetical protein VFE05_21855 [Longimicrobiaceae bacterium]|jgi:hypothetical protein|nr:hypothetical protein [Longimicrobiaceae bacterium]